MCDLIVFNRRKNHHVIAAGIRLIAHNQNTDTGNFYLRFSV